MHAEVTRRQDGQAWARRIFLFLYIISLLFTLYPGDGPPAHLSREGAGEGTRSSSSVFAQAMSPQELWSLREDAREAFYHGFDAYMAHGYPWDEVKPLSCLGRRWDKRERGTLDDPLGGMLCVKHAFRSITARAPPLVPSGSLPP